jgi:translation initiation factor IF-1
LRGGDGERALGFDPAVSVIVEAEVVEELPSLIYRLVLQNQASVLGHLAGNDARNFVRLRPGDRVEVDLSPHDGTRGRIVKKI